MSEGTFEYDLFISFASDDQALVRPLWQELTSAGLRVFWSDSALRERVGTSWFDVIQQSLIHSRHLLVVFTPSSLRSEWVRREYVAFFSHYYRPPGRLLVPALAGNSTFDDLPLFLRELEACRIEDAHASRRLIRIFGGIDVEALQLELAARNEQISALTLQTASLQRDLKSLQARLAVTVTLESELLALREEAKALREKGQFLQAERDSARTRVEALARRVSIDGGTHSRELERFVVERETMISKIAELQLLLRERSALPEPPKNVRPTTPSLGVAEAPAATTERTRLRNRKLLVHGGIKLWIATATVNVILLNIPHPTDVQGRQVDITTFLLVIFGIGALWFIGGAVAAVDSYHLAWLLVPAGLTVCIFALIGVPDAYQGGILCEGPAALAGLAFAITRRRRSASADRPGRSSSQK